MSGPDQLQPRARSRDVGKQSRSDARTGGALHKTCAQAPVNCCK